MGVWTVRVVLEIEDGIESAPTITLKYLLELNRWQAAQEETENILLVLSSCPKGKPMSEILKSEFSRSETTEYQNSFLHVQRKVPTQQLQKIAGM